MAIGYQNGRRPAIQIRELSHFCDRHGIKHELSSPYNPESNGLAEAAVKNIKAIITRCSKEGENIKLAIAAWRNMHGQTASLQVSCSTEEGRDSCYP